MAPRLRFTMTNGDEWIAENSFGGDGLADEVAFEREFKMSSAVLAIAGGKAQAHLAAVEEAVKAGEEPPEPDGAVFPRQEWMAFFAWRQLRRTHPGLLPAKFQTFVDEVESMEYFDDEDAEATPAAAADEDPLVVEAVAQNGVGLDPTDPDPLRTPPRSSYSTASATPISN